MRIRKVVLWAGVIVIGLPVVLLVVAGVAFYALMSAYAPNRNNGSIVSAGERRDYLLYVPASYDRARPTPLVISFHAAALWPSTQQEVSQWNRLADEHGFLVVYPSGTTLAGSGSGALPFRVWLLRPEENVEANVGFVSDLIDELAAAYNIDPLRIYANGFSNGGAMAFALSCRLADRIAAVGTVSAAQDQQPWSWCGDAQPTPFINFHGTDDLVPLEGGRVFASPDPFPDVATWTASWAQRNHCAPIPSQSAATEDVTRLEYTACADDAAVVLYRIGGGGHTWPGGKPLPKWLVGPTSRSIDATRLMWTFFVEHPRRGSP